MIPTSLLVVIAAVAVFTSFMQYPSILLIIAGIYFALRALKLLSHSGCMACWKKAFLSGIIFISLAITLPVQAIVGAMLLMALGVLSVVAKPSSQ